MDIKAINTAIIGGTFTNEQLNSIIDAVKYARTKLGNANKRTIKVGAKVAFESSKLGRRVEGTVTKVAIKNITVDTPNGAWRVPANMLEVV